MGGLIHRKLTSNELMRNIEDNVVNKVSGQKGQIVQWVCSWVDSQYIVTEKLRGRKDMSEENDLNDR